FLTNLPLFLEKMKEEYDYILIDSIPTMKIDSVFVQCSDKIIIPCFADSVTVKGVINVVNEAGADKILAILLNKYENKKVQNFLREQITEVIKGTNILFPNPIKNISEIEDLLFKGKTIWESNSKKIEEIKRSIALIGEALLEDKGEKEDDFSFDIDF
ncbi:MAG: ParA family protein, partial [Cetobacterium sp.]